MKKQKIILWSSGILVAIVFTTGFIFRDHLGYLVYLFSFVKDAEIRNLEKSLMQVLEDNPEKLFEEVRKEYENNYLSKDVCHGVLHKLGHESVEGYGFEKTMQIAVPLCGAGFIHGAIETRLGLFLDEDELSGQILDLCNSKDEFCNHGLGHGLMIFFKNDFEKSLSHCDLLEEPAHSDCYDGVFMHIFDNEETGISKDVEVRYEAEKLCNRVDQKYQKSCAFYLPRLFVENFNSQKFAKSVCDLMSSENQIACIFGTGTMLGKYRSFSDEVIKKKCEVFEEKSYVCIEGIETYQNEVFDPSVK